MAKAVKEVFLKVWHGLCTFRIMQNVVKHRSEANDEESSTSDEQTIEENDK
jgi:hypothetical protein